MYHVWKRSECIWLSSTWLFRTYICISELTHSSPCLSVIYSFALSILFEIYYFLSYWLSLFFLKVSHEDWITSNKYFQELRKTQINGWARAKEELYQKAVATFADAFLAEELQRVDASVALICFCFPGLMKCELSFIIPAMPNQLPHLRYIYFRVWVGVVKEKRRAFKNWDL